MVNVTLDWTPQKVHLWLRNWQLLLEASNGGVIRANSYDDDTRGGITPDPLALVTIKADLDRALLRLRQLDGDPLAAAWIVDCYHAGMSTADIADREQVAQRTVQWRIQRGRSLMAEYLGYCVPLRAALYCMPS